MGGFHAGKQTVPYSSPFCVFTQPEGWRVDARPNQSWTPACDIRLRPAQHPSSGERQPSDLPQSLLMRFTRRRPSPAMVVALIALFVALGGPAQAKRVIDGGSIRKGTITSRQIKNGSVAKADLSKTAVSSLTATPPSSVRSGQIADGQVLAPDLGLGSVGAGQLAPGAVTASKLAPDSIGGGSVANGSLQTVDIGSFTGSVNVDFSGFND